MLKKLKKLITKTTTKKEEVKDEVREENRNIWKEIEKTPSERERKEYDLEVTGQGWAIEGVLR